MHVPFVGHVHQTTMCLLPGCEVKLGTLLKENGFVIVIRPSNFERLLAVFSSSMLSSAAMLMLMRRPIAL